MATDQDEDVGWGCMRGDPRKQNWASGEGEIDDGKHPVQGQATHLNSTGNVSRMYRAHRGGRAGTWIHQLSFPTP